MELSDYAVKVAALEAWIASDPKNIVKTASVPFPNMGYGLMAKETIQKEEIALAIHKSYFISMDVVHENKFMQENILKLENKLNNRQLLALYLWYEMNLRDESKWSLYFKALPENYGNVCLWSVEDINKLGRVEYIDKFIEKRKRLEKEYDTMSMINQSSINKKMEIKDYLWLVAIIESRTVSIPSKFDPNFEVGALIPYFDFANHRVLYDNENNQEETKEASTSNHNDRKVVNYMNYFVYNAGTEQFMLKCHKMYKPGEQVFIMYSAKPNIHFLEYYGFIPQENPFNCINVTESIENVFMKQILNEYSNNLGPQKLNILSRVLPNMVIQVKKDKIPKYESQHQKNQKGTSKQQKINDKIDYQIVDKIVVEIGEDGQCQWQLSTFCKIVSLTDGDVKNLEPEKWFDLMELEFFASEGHKRNFVKVLRNISCWLNRPIVSLDQCKLEETIICDSRLLAKEFIKAEKTILGSFDKYLDSF